MKKDNKNKSSRQHSLLSYPYDCGLILRKKQAIKRELLLKDSLLVKKIAILGGSTTSEIKDILELFLLNQGIKPEFYESEFNRYFEESVFENKALQTFKPDIIYLHLTHKNINTFPEINNSLAQIEHLLQQEQEKLSRIWASLAQYQCPIIQNNFDPPQYRILGNLDSSDPHGALNYINKLNSFLAESAQKQSHLHIHDINYLAARIGLERWFDYPLWYTAKYAVSYEAIPHLAQSLSAVIAALSGMAKKCLVLDLDNTCWGGQIGDDGLEGIAIGRDSALAEVFADFQHYLKLLKSRGIILAICSKNDLAVAKNGFTHPDTVLTEQDFSAFEANWEDKDKNLLKIADQLNLGLDSFVFIDDNPAERQLIHDALPQVNVPDIGSDPAHFINIIDKNYYFETSGITAEDVNRHEFYSRKAMYDKPEHRLDYGAYLDSLAMSAEIKPFSAPNVPRITQLINKTHQFNLTNKTYTANEIESISNDPDYIGLYGRLADVYGDHGLISVIIGHIHDKECHIESWLMSCRVFKRTMEYALFDALTKKCKESGIETIKGYYNPTSKNGLVIDLYKNLGFTCVENKNHVSIWQLQLKNYKKKNYHIKVN
ncbi:HAD-IIIC family phosphatase [Legionella shakespearei]|uniref:HAD-superfamily phosphatase n=1 Tax=Legionella shakespearei DSM 23087 TaxID=1122169 RepID=A0A0W0YVM3_9GAMM|nr:HAD-IIIC family phosphatase [Legionella shakespearei]KTD60702.1 HAD-superfamily phosphatase [Legionella shakespearei DSM 23087]